MKPTLSLPFAVLLFPLRGLGGFSLRFIFLLIVLFPLRGLAGFCWAQKPESKLLDSLFLVAVKANNLTEVKKLVEQGANVNVKDIKGYAPLHISVIQGDSLIVKFLLDKRADINIKTSDNNDTPLLISIISNQYHIGKMLLHSKADTTIINKLNQSFIYLIKEIGWISPFWQLLPKDCQPKFPDKGKLKIYAMTSPYNDSNRDVYYITDDNKYAFVSNGIWDINTQKILHKIEFKKDFSFKRSIEIPFKIIQDKNDKPLIKSPIHIDISFLKFTDNLGIYTAREYYSKIIDLNQGTVTNHLDTRRNFHLTTPLAILPKRKLVLLTGENRLFYCKPDKQKYFPIQSANDYVEPIDSIISKNLFFDSYGYVTSKCDLVDYQSGRLYQRIPFYSEIDKFHIDENPLDSSCCIYLKGESPQKFKIEKKKELAKEMWQISTKNIYGDLLVGKQIGYDATLVSKTEDKILLGWINASGGGGYSIFNIDDNKLIHLDYLTKYVKNLDIYYGNIGFTFDEKYVYATDDKQSFFWNIDKSIVETPKHIYKQIYKLHQIDSFFKESRPVWWYNFFTLKQALNNKHLVTGCKDLQIWDIEKQELIHKIENVGDFYYLIINQKRNSVIGIVKNKNNEDLFKEWDLESGKELKSTIWKFGTDGDPSFQYLTEKYFYDATLFQSIEVYDIYTQELILTYHFVPTGTDKDYITITPDGRFDGTPEGMKKLLHFVVGNEVVELEQLKDRYYEPGLWKKLLGYSTEPLRNIQDIKDKGLDLYPETILKLNENKLTIKLLPRSGGVGKVSLFVGNKRIAEDLNPQRKTEFTVDLKQYNQFFSIGQADTIGIVAYEREGTLPSRPEIIEYEADLDFDVAELEKEKKRQPHFYGVFIGTSNYQDGSGLRDLAYPTKDAQDLSKAMQLAAQNLLIEPQNVQITLLSTDDKNNLPSKANIRKILEGLAQSKDIRKEDVLVVYFSGHGVSYTVDNKDQFFYITQDLSSKNLDDKVVREAFTISTEEIAQWMVNVVARKQVLILDACASGKAVEQAQELLAKKEVPTSQKRALELLKDRTGIFVISGSTSDASSYEASPYGQGFLTYALLSGITGGALQNGEYVDVMSLFQYAANRVPEIAEEFGVIQQPQIATPAKVNSFPIGKVGDKEKKAIQIAQPKPFFVRSSFFNPEENEDNLNLGDLLNQSIRENMGAGRSASAIFFDVNNHPQGYKIIGNYSLNGNVIQVKWQIKNQKTGEKSKEFINEGEKSELEDLTKKIFQLALERLNN